MMTHSRRQSTRLRSKSSVADIDIEIKIEIEDPPDFDPKSSTMSNDDPHLQSFSPLKIPFIKEEINDDAETTDRKDQDDQDQDNDCNSTNSDSSFTKAPKAKVKSKSSSTTRSTVRIHECNICFRVFPARTNLTKHKRSHSAERYHKCTVCTQSFRDKRSLKSHMCTHEEGKEKAHKCDLCHKSFGFRQGLLRHVLRVHVVDKAFECTICNRKYIDESTLTNHRKTHYKPPQYQCDMCSKFFKVRKSILYHLRTQHGKNCICFICWKSFTDNAEFDDHLVTSNDDNEKLRCQLCNEVFQNQCILTQHTDGHINQIQQKQISGNVNANGVKKEVELLEIQSKVSGDSTKDSTLFACNFCPMIFERTEHLTLHLRNIHPNLHKVENFYKCNSCPKTFSHRYRLLRHEKIHSDIRDFHCHRCPKSFLRAEDLKMHGIVHSDNKKFKCTVKNCKKAFHHMFDLKKHLAGVHGDEKYQTHKCQECGRGWASKCQLDEHMLKHTKEKNFKCDLCEAKFKHKRHVYGHKRRWHPNPENSDTISTETKKPVGEDSEENEEMD